MTQDELWLTKYNEVMAFMETHRRNPSKHNDEERGRYLNWIKHNRKQLNSGTLKPGRIPLFEQLLALSEKYRRVNQYD